MADLSELSLRLRAFLKVYPWRRIDPVPRAELRRPVEQARVALVSSAGLVAPDQEPFDEDIKGGDPSYRVLGRELEPASLREFHRSESFDHAGIVADRNLALPLEPLRALAADGAIGEVAPRHLSFMGSITAPGRLVRDHVPAAAEIFVEDQVDIALLVPV
jgi:D-proline reductase (dithiol) PrdB